MNLKITVLGSGTSHGVPLIGCDCAVCRSADPRDRRLRPSILIEIAGAAPDSGAAASSFAQSVRSILVDTSTDLRAQALGHDIRRVDAVLFTHSHADHVMGLDDVRRFNVMQKSAIACYGDARTRADLTRMFAYIFEQSAAAGGTVPSVGLLPATPANRQTRLHETYRATTAGWPSSAKWHPHRNNR